MGEGVVGPAKAGQVVEQKRGVVGGGCEGVGGGQDGRDDHLLGDEIPDCRAGMVGNRIRTYTSGVEILLQLADQFLQLVKTAHDFQWVIRAHGFAPELRTDDLHDVAADGEKFQAVTFDQGLKICKGGAADGVAGFF